MNLPASDLLTRATAARRVRVEALKLDTPGYRLRERLGTVRPAGRLERALRRGAASNPLRLLCGILRASPTKGVLRAEVDAAALARIYGAGGAAGISVATEPERSLGDLAWVGAVRDACALPVLVDDLVVDEYQLLDAAVRGADGVLLIAALCSDVQLQVLASGARLLGLDPLVEVHDADELRRALKAGATLLGLGSREPDAAARGLATALELLPVVPPLVTAVAWSVDSQAATLERLRDTRCDAVLAGEVLLSGSDPATALATLAATARG
jgi:indole-3-glycerol phosphate synthase